MRAMRRPLLSEDLQFLSFGAEMSYYFLSAGDTPPCDPGWRQVADDAGNQTCVQPLTGDYGYCPPGQTGFRDSAGDLVCYSGGAPGATPQPQIPLPQQASSFLSQLGLGQVSGTAAILLLGLAAILLIGGRR